MNWLQKIQSYLRWPRLMQLRANTSKVLFINRRNLHYVYLHNHRRHFPLADNKLKLKSYFTGSEIPMADTLASYSYFYELRNLEQQLSPYNDFVIKPASGRGGGGILVLKERHPDGWLNMGGKLYTVQDIKKQIADILFGVYSFSLNDQAIVEQRILQHEEVDKLSPHGLADVRVILHLNKPVMCMIRIATKDSNGTANLHQGAIGAAVDWESGRTFHASQKGISITQHPDTGRNLIDVMLPHWDTVKDLSLSIAKSVPLKYLGIDIALGKTSPFLLEINARPGIEIQNVNNLGMRAVLESLTHRDMQS